jgi:ABC-2 type transport system permease protein
MRKFLTQVKREFWECRTSFIKTPMVTAGILIGLLLLGIAPWHHRIAGLIERQYAAHPEVSIFGNEVFSELGKHQNITTDAGYLVHGFAAVYTIFALILLLVLAFYFTDTLYSDRRDQSILFWKSMPISERDTVLGKLVAGVVGAPAFYAGAALVTGVAFLLIFVVYAGFIWNIPVPAAGAMAGTFLMCSLGLVLGWQVMAAWYLPIFCWLLFCSAFVRKAPFLMALGGPLALVVLEKWVVGSHHTFQILGNHIVAGFYSFEIVINDLSALPSHLAATASALQFWLGLAAGGLLLSASVWLRTNRWEI